MKGAKRALTAQSSPAALRATSELARASHQLAPKGAAIRRAANPFQAFRDMVLATDVDELAANMGLKVGTLYNKADADEGSHHKPTLRDVVLATRATGDMRVLDALDAMFGRVAYVVSDKSHCSDIELLNLLAKLGAQNGEFHAVLFNALADGKFTQAELEQVRAEAHDVISALLALVDRLKGMVDA